MSEKGKYSKTKLIGKRWIVVVVIFLVALLIAGISFMIYVNVNNNIIYENVNEDSSIVDDNIASKSTPIVINNIILGGVYNGRWVGMERYYFKSVNKQGYDIDIFTAKGKTGTFKIKNVDKGNEAGAAYVTTTRTNYKDEYFAVRSGSTTTAKMDKITLGDDNLSVYENFVKEALGFYKMLNGTVKIREVYEVALIPGKISYIITATSDGKTGSGVYSAVVYVSETENVQLVKYNYVKDVNNSSDFGIYTTKFISDLNDDKVCEIILQETKEFNTEYSVVEFNNGKFTEVLSTTIGN
ncbi:MAG: hypothetical protein K0R72_209 [Clostridia bacterium]|nr:hypothetical protein [Clostridia bacterium]